MKKILLVVLMIASAGAANARGADGDFLHRKKQALERAEAIRKGPVDPELERCGGIAIVVNDEKIYCQ